MSNDFNEDAMTFFITHLFYGNFQKAYNVLSTPLKQKTSPKELEERFKFLVLEYGKKTLDLKEILYTLEEYPRLKDFINLLAST